MSANRKLASQIWRDAVMRENVSRRQGRAIAFAWAELRADAVAMAAAGHRTRARELARAARELSREFVSDSGRAMSVRARLRTLTRRSRQRVAAEVS